MTKIRIGPIQRWGNKVDWKRRVKAVCKPCWEIKYCPYGPLIEQFPIKEISDEKSCRIFGHDCPVFFVAEPLTETKELRNIGRAIPRVTQFRVLKRDNQICRNCGDAVRDQDVEFDHIIPWSKGGSSDEHNIKLLCKTCNRKKGKKFEDQHLVESVANHLVEPAPFLILYTIMEFVKLSHKIYKEEHRELSVKDITKWFGRRKVREQDKVGAELVSDIQQFLLSAKPTEIPKKFFNALKYRWGYPSRELHTLKESSNKYDISVADLFSIEASFFERLGWPIVRTESNLKKWLKL